MSDTGQSELVVVTGASGYIGMYCTLELLKAGYRVRGTLRDLRRADALRVTLAEHAEIGDRLSFVEANLEKDGDWPQVMSDVDLVLHVASPLPRREPKNPEDLIRPAREGALSVLRAASNARVKRVVMTSSVAAVFCGYSKDEARTFNESDWSRLSGPMGAYERSKTIAEKAAWDFARGLDGDDKVELVTINPGFVLGPLLSKDFSVSLEIVLKLLRRQVPGCPQLNLALVDVRDVATAHVTALRAEKAPGNRFILANKPIPFVNVAKILHRHFADQGYRIPQRELPNWLLRIVALFDGTVRLIVPELNKANAISCRQANELLDWKSRSTEEIVVATARSLIEHDLVLK